MNKVLAILLGIAMLLAVWLYLNPVIPAESILVNKGFIDSLEQVANIPPDTVTIETITVKRDTIYKNVLVPVSVKGDTAYYKDSLTEPEFSIYVSDVLFGNRIADRTWSFEKRIAETTKYITITKPLPVPYEVTKPPKLFVGVGYGYNGFFVEGGGYYKRYYYGVEVGRGISVKGGITW